MITTLLAEHTAFHPPDTLFSPRSSSSQPYLRAARGCELSPPTARRLQHTLGQPPLVHRLSFNILISLAWRNALAPTGHPLARSRRTALSYRISLAVVRLLAEISPLKTCMAA